MTWSTLQGRPVYEAQLPLISRQAAVCCPAITKAGGGSSKSIEIDLSELLSQAREGQ